MKLVFYRVERLQEPEGDNTHQVVYESMTKNKFAGGFNYGIRFRGTYKECLRRKRELENELYESKTRGFSIPREI